VHGAPFVGRAPAVAMSRVPCDLYAACWVVSTPADELRCRFRDVLLASRSQPHSTKRHWQQLMQPVYINVTSHQASVADALADNYNRSRSAATDGPRLF